MSQFRATITNIQTNSSINIVTFKAASFTLQMMSLKLNEKVTLGSEVILGVKASSVAVAKEFHGLLSYSNQLPLQIDKIQDGELLCSIQLRSDDFNLESVITKASKERMCLSESDRVTALIKSSDLYIVEVL